MGIMIGLLQTTRDWLATGQASQLYGFSWVCGITLVLLSSASHRTACRRRSRHQMMACKPLSAMTLSSLSAGPAGRVSPCSHLRTVEAVVCRWCANTG